MLASLVEISKAFGLSLVFKAVPVSQLPELPEGYPTPEEQRRWSDTTKRWRLKTARERDYAATAAGHSDYFSSDNLGAVGSEQAAYGKRRNPAKITRDSAEYQRVGDKPPAKPRRLKRQEKAKARLYRDAEGRRTVVMAKPSKHDTEVKRYYLDTERGRSDPAWGRRKPWAQAAYNDLLGERERVRALPDEGNPGKSMALNSIQQKLSERYSAALLEPGSFAGDWKKDPSLKDVS